MVTGWKAASRAQVYPPQPSGPWRPQLQVLSDHLAGVADLLRATRAPRSRALSPVCVLQSPRVLALRSGRACLLSPARPLRPLATTVSCESGVETEGHSIDRL